MRREELPDLWSWLYPDPTEPKTDDFSEQNVAELKFSENNDLGDDLDPGSRQRRSPFDPVDHHDIEDHEPVERFGRRILNKTEGKDNKTETIKELNTGYFEMKEVFLHPGNGTGNGTVGNGTASGGNATAASAPPGKINNTIV